jgi:hypothetical protein
MSLAIMPAEPGPVASDRGLPMAGARVASTLRRPFHLSGSHPHALGRVLPWLRPTVGKRATRRRRLSDRRAAYSHSLCFRFAHRLSGREIGHYSLCMSTVAGRHRWGLGF